MRPDVVAATRQVVAARARLAHASDHDALVDEIEDALCDGYAQALAADAWLDESQRRLHELMQEGAVESRARDLQALVREHGDFQSRVRALRQELESLRREHSRRRAGSPWSLSDARGERSRL